MAVQVTGYAGTWGEARLSTLHSLEHLKIAATIFSPSPTHFCCTAPMRTLMKVAPDSFAMA